MKGLTAPGDTDYPFGGLYTAAPGSGQTGILAGNLFQPGTSSRTTPTCIFVTCDTAGTSDIWRANAP